MPEITQDPNGQDSNDRAANGPSKIAEALRPIAKEVIKGGLMTYHAGSPSPFQELASS